MLNFVAIDIETTGFSLETCEIIELGGLKYKNGQPIDTFSMYVKPQKYVPLQISKITGITMETLSMADGPEVCIPKFVEFCEDLPLLGHNLKFDYEFIKKYSSQYDFDFTLGNIIGTNIFNIGIVLGLPLMLCGGITPISFAGPDMIMLLISALLLFLFAGSDKIISKKEGIMLLIIFVIYYVYLFLE